MVQYLRLIDMEQQARKIVKEILRKRKVEGIVGLREVHGHVVPALFQTEDDVKSLVLRPKYDLSRVYLLLKNSYPAKKLAILGRGCDERALTELAKREQLDFNDMKFIGVACTEEEAKTCGCTKPYPSRIDVGKAVKTRIQPKTRNTGSTLEDRFEFWHSAFSRCIKCYGCVEACPLCFCEECLLEETLWVKKGKIPPAFPTFHLIRAYHAADRCVECGECEQACPMEIPLLTLFRAIRQDVVELFGYVAGEKLDEKPPLITPLEGDLLEVGD